MAGQALGDLGYKDGQSVTLDIRYAEGKFDQLPALAKDLVAQNPNIIVAVSGEALFATAQATTTIPIVSATGGGDCSRIIPSNQSRGQSGSKPVQLRYTPNRREKIRQIICKTNRHQNKVSPRLNHYPAQPLL